MVALALGLVAQAQAALFIEHVSVTPTTASSLAFDFAQFDPGLGTLNSVELVLTPVVGDIGYQAFNIGAPQSVAFASVSSPHGTLTGLGLNAAWSSSETHEHDNFSANSGLNTGSLPFSSFVTAPSSITVGPAGFLGAGTYSLLLTAADLATAGGSASPSIFYGHYENVGGTLEVDFNYTAAPESASTAMFAGLSALGFVLVAMRKQFAKAV